MAKKFLITGATGFVGSHLARRLVHRGEDVHIIRRPSSDTWRLKDVIDSVREYQADLRDSVKLEKIIAQIKPDIVFHCAVYGARLSEQDPVLSAQINLSGTLYLVQALMKAGYEQFIHTGSAAEYGFKRTPMNESDILEPNTDYGVTKAAAGLYCQMMARYHNQRILILRLLSPYGPYDEAYRLIPAVINKCLKGQSPELSPGDEARSFFYIDDLIDLYLKVIRTNWPSGEIVNIGPNEQYSVRDIATRIIRLTGSTVRPLFGAFPRRQFDTDFWLADTQKAKTLFQWAPQIGIDEGLRLTIEWYRARVDEPELLSKKMA